VRNLFLRRLCGLRRKHIGGLCPEPAKPAGQEATKATDPMHANAKTEEARSPRREKKSMTKSGTGHGAKDGMKRAPQERYQVIQAIR